MVEVMSVKQAANGQWYRQATNDQWYPIDESMATSIQSQSTGNGLIFKDPTIDNESVELSAPNQIDDGETSDMSQVENLNPRQRNIQRLQQNASRMKAANISKEDALAAQKIIHANPNITPEMADSIVKARRDLAKDTSPALSGVIAAGRWADKIGSGTMDLVDRGLAKYSSDENKQQYIDSIAARKKDQAGKDAAYAPLASEHGIATTLGEIAPSLATLPLGIASQTARILPAALSASRAAPAIKTALELGKEGAIGAAEGAAHYDDTALGGAATGFLGSAAVRGLTKPFRGSSQDALTKTEKGTVDWAEKQGLMVPPGMYTGNVTQQNIDNFMSTNMGSSEVYKDILRESKKKETNLISRELGQETDEFSPEYLSDARDIITNRLDNMVEKSDMKVGSGLLKSIDSINNKFKMLNPEGKRSPLIDNYSEKLQGYFESGKSMSGKQFQLMTKQLNQATTNAYRSGNMALATSLGDISGKLYDSVGVAVGEGWKDARKKYALLSSIEKTLPQSSERLVGGSAGFVDAAKLAKKFKGNDTIDKLADYSTMKKQQAKASLSGMSALNKALNPMDYGLIKTASMLSGSKASAFDPVSKALSKLYLSGYPTKKGVLGNDTAGMIGNKLGLLGVRGLSTSTESGETEEEKRQKLINKGLMQGY
jgi:hypothetical protein